MTKLFTRVITEEEDINAYQPGKDINLFTIQHILEVLNSRGSNDIPIHQTKELDEISDSLQRISKTINESPINKRLMDI